ncbi:MAG: hypothetical protein ACJ8AW_06600 [Rhodopila sp.]
MARLVRTVRSSICAATDGPDKPDHDDVGTVALHASCSMLRYVSAYVPPAAVSGTASETAGNILVQIRTMALLHHPTGNFSCLSQLPLHWLA